MAHIIDPQRQALIKELDAGEERAAMTKAYLDEQFAHNIFAVKGYINTVNNISRLGTPMHWQEFEKKMGRLPYGQNLVFREFSLRPFRGVCYKLPNNELLSISGYGKTIIPEFSTMDIERKAVPDPSVRHLSYKDFPEMVWDGDPVVGLDNYKNQKGFKTKDGSLKPGWRYEDQMVGENPTDPFARGWRTVLCRWLALGVAGKMPCPSVEAIEKEFAAANSPQWAKYTGKQRIESPF